MPNLDYLCSFHLSLSSLQTMEARRKQTSMLSTLPNPSQSCFITTSFIAISALYSATDWYVVLQSIGRSNFMVGTFPLRSIQAGHAYVTIHFSTSISRSFSTTGNSSVNLFGSLMSAGTSSLVFANSPFTIPNFSSRAVYSLITSPVVNSTKTLVSLTRNMTSSRRMKKRQRRSNLAGITRILQDSIAMPLSASSSS